ncbi:MAG: T9SS type A sorting domain-containing protein [Vicingaceae bacterium]
MRKNYTLLLLPFFCAYFSMAQTQSNAFPLLPQNKQAKKKIKPKQNKSFGDTLYYQDFSGQLPSGWSTQGVSDPTHLWQWSNSAPGGQYSTNLASLQSPTASNGFLVLPSDQYNTPTPTNGFVSVNSSITSAPIPIRATPSVHLTLYQSQRFCCTQANTMYVEVSADSVNWTVFPLTNHRLSEASSENGEFVKLNVSAVLGNQNTAYLRFVQSGSSHYYWMIDDVALLEGPRNQLEIKNLRLTQLDTFDRQNNFTRIDENSFCPTTVNFDIENIGEHTVTNSQCVVEIRSDSLSSSTFNILTSDTIYLTASISPGSRVFASTTTITHPILTGYYTTTLSCTADSTFDSIVSDSLKYNITDTTLSRHVTSNFSESVGVSQFLGGGNSGDFIGILFNLNRYRTVQSVSFFISDTLPNIGVQIVPKIYNYEKDSLTLNAALTQVVAENLVPTTIDTSMLGEWLTLDFSFGTGPVTLQQGQYVAGYSFSGGIISNSSLLLGRDREAESQQVVPQSLVLINDSTPEWKWISQAPAIEVRFFPPMYGPGTYPCPTLVGQPNEEFSNIEDNVSVFPNPTTGIITLKNTQGFSKQAQVQVYDLKGKLLYQTAINREGIEEVTLQLDQLSNGLYILQIQDGEQFSNQKLMIQR